MLLVQNFCETAHADTADSHEMDVDRIVKINFIHDKYLPCIFLIHDNRMFAERVFYCLYLKQL